MKSAPLNSKEKNILLTTCCGHFLSHFNMLVFPALVLPLSTRFDLNLTTVIGFSFWMYLLFGLTALPWGIIADRLGARPLFFIFYTGAGLSGLAAAAGLDSEIILPLALAALGFFSGIYHPIGLGLISKEISRISLAMGYNGMFGNLGLGMAPLLTGLVNWLWGPKAVFLVLSGINFCGLLFLYLAPLSESPKVAKSLDQDNNKSLKVFLIMLVAMMLGGLVYRGSTLITPAYFELNTKAVYNWFTTLFNGRISNNLLATTTTSFIFLIGMTAQYTGGKLAEKIHPRYCYLLFHLITIPMAFLIAKTSDLTLIVCTAIYFFFLLGMQPSENTLVAGLVPQRFRHSAYGLKFILTFGVGAFAVQIIGIIQSTFGIRAIFQGLGSISAVLVTVILILIYELRQKPFLLES